MHTRAPKRRETCARVKMVSDVVAGGGRSNNFECERTIIVAAGTFLKCETCLERVRHVCEQRKLEVFWSVCLKQTQRPLKLVSYLKAIDLKKQRRPLRKRETKQTNKRAAFA